MGDKARFSFLIREAERKALKGLAESADRSEGATLRQLIREAAIERGLLPGAAKAGQVQEGGDHERKS